VRQILADSRQTGEIFALPEHGHDAARQTVQSARGVTVSAHAERVGVFNLEQIGQPVEHLSNVGVMYRQDLTCASGRAFKLLIHG
jgi:hypothetical protein